MGKGDAPEIEETEMQKELALIASEKWDMSKELIQPLEDQMIAETSKGVTDTQREAVSGALAVSHQAQFGGAQTDASKQMSASGVDPTSGKASATLSDLAISGSSSRAVGEAEGEIGLQSKQMQEEMNLINVGTGEASGAQQGMMDVTGRASQKAINEAQVGFQKSQSTQQLAGTLAGLGATYYGNQPKMTDAQLAKKHGIS
ncbi:hypothetical protein NVP1205O_16 [Vibrio phage 1.205.O._10N.222.51.A7]|nr:hypothetical protein NVP1205O_16 [Vibrio phage 1.205.O._10N.222.51.A7]